MQKKDVRKLQDGNWFWIDKEIIQNYIPKINASSFTTYCFLASLADKNQFCYPSQKHIAECLGYSRSSINKALKRLEENKLILKIKKYSQSSGKSCGYLLLDISKCNLEETNLSHEGNHYVAQVHTNKNNITRIINKKGIINNSINYKKAFKQVRPKTRYELLALDIAEILNDYNNLEHYLELARKYPESILRKLLGEVREIPEEKIKTTKANLFKYLIKKYDEKNKNNSGNQSRS